MPTAKRAMLTAKLRRDLPPTMARSCAFWVCVQSMNFRVVPPTYNLLVNNCAFSVWMTYVSYLGFRGAKSPDASVGVRHQQQGR